ncbi:MAG TPA: lysine--tRNA ligase [Candidatus Saccharimonadales bacterium]|nr:lysine--tRNA ligase [Candidatus Saccharimonadales bacterium]
MASESNLEQIRLEKIEKLKEAGMNPFQHSFNKTHTIAQAIASEGKVVKTAGRVFSYREHGNIAFADLGDETGRIQVFFQKKILGDSFRLLKLLDIGDFIGVEGEVGKTIAGEISILPSSFTVLTKSLRSLPSEWYGLKDTETRYRQRYLDLLLNPEVRERFNIRTKLISGVREYLNSLGFWEVETPALQVMYGGTNAKPFTTHLHALDQDMYLRIAVELYIKRLIAGGYEKVYEIAKDFRNEGIDNSHFPEFTMLEWYEAYVDYHKMMDRAEELLKFLAQKLYGHTTLQVDDKKIDIGNTWPRITMVAILKEKLQLDVEKETEESLLAYLKTHCPDVHLTGKETKGQLIFAIFDHKIPRMLKEPTWIYDYPADVSPLARPHREKEGWVERYEGYIGGKEIFDGWTEITDSRIQRKAWEKDQTAARADKEEAQHVDEDFLAAMEYGMPPYGGIGVGLDRLTMLFTNTWTIKELILFPTLKRDKGEREEESQSAILGSETTPESDSGQARMTMEKADVSKVSLTRDKAYTLLAKYMASPNLIKHSLAAEAAMKGIYRYLYGDTANAHDEESWGITGLLHDIDYELAQKEDKLEKHGRLLFDRDPSLVEEPIQHAIKAHNYTKTGTDPETDLDWAIATVDQLTGLVVSSALISPTKKLADIDADFVLKRFYKPGFSKGVDRENVKLCETQLGIPLEKFISITLSSMQQIAPQLGL